MQHRQESKHAAISRGKKSSSWNIWQQCGIKKTKLGHRPWEARSLGTCDTVNLEVIGAKPRLVTTSNKDISVRNEQIQILHPPWIETKKIEHVRRGRSRDWFEYSWMQPQQFKSSAKEWRKRRALASNVQSYTFLLCIVTDVVVKFTELFV